MLGLNFKKLPNTYLYNEESLTGGKFVDGNSLWVMQGRGYARSDLAWG